MNSVFKVSFIPFVAAFLAAAGCAHGDGSQGAASSSAARAGQLSNIAVSPNDNMNAVLWMQTAAEYRGNSLVIYQSAAGKLSHVIAAKDHTASIEQGEMAGCVPGHPCANAKFKKMPSAIVLDIDETVLDNSAYQARLIRDNAQWDANTWDEWIASREAGAIPGAVDFIRAVKESGAAVVYITNRNCSVRSKNAGADPCPQREDTLENMKALGFPSLSGKDLLLLQNQRPEWGASEKRARREYVAKSYRIAMLIGDDLGDLAPDVKSLSIDSRFDAVNKYRDLYGVYWFQLANPTYGSWMNPFKGKDKRDFLRYD
tara:strand:- start:37456 stop:38400 length:945 start_codon:yes stop_codon:yes gene_type:complete